MRRPPMIPAAGTGRNRVLTLRSYLTVVALAVLLPMFGLGAIATHQVVMAYQNAYQERLRATARLLGSALDSAIEMRRAAIMALADAPSFDTSNAADLYDYAKQIGNGLGTWVAVNTRDRQVLNTRRPYGSAPTPRQWAWETGAIGHYRVTNLLYAADLPAPFVSVIGPVARGGKVVAMVSIPFAEHQLSQRLAEGLIDSDGFVCLLDGNGAVIARTRAQDKPIGNRAPSWILSIAAMRGAPIAMGRMPDGADVIVATAHPSAAPQWTVVVGEPVRGYYRQWVRPLMVLGGGGLALLVMLLLAVDRFSVWLVRPLTALTRSAKMVASGQERPPDAHLISRVAEFEALRVSLNDAAQVMDGRAEAINLAFASARRERNLLHSVVNGTSDPTFVKDKGGRFVLVNAAGLALLGLPAAMAIGQVHSEPGAATANGGDTRAEDSQVIASGLPMMIERTIETGRDRRTFLGTKSPWRSTAGEVLGVVVIIHDVTEWKRSENRLRDIQAELIRTGRLSAMGAMANGLAHELNQPLSAITNFLGAARRLIARAPELPGASLPVADPSGPGLSDPGLSGADLPAPYQALGVARGAIDDACIQAIRAGEIVSRLRDFIGRGVASMRIENIGALVADACALAMPQDIRARVALHLSIDPDLEPVFVDRVQIQQVLVNLVLNAVQSMADCARQELTIDAGRDATGDTCITLSDTGTGIPEPMLAEVFEPFVSTRPDGLGMGLAIARMIVAAHGGTLTARNNKAGGATLMLVLPAVLSMEDAHV